MTTDHRHIRAEMRRTIDGSRNYRKFARTRPYRPASGITTVLALIAATAAIFMAAGYGMERHYQQQAIEAQNRCAWGFEAYCGNGGK